MATNRQIIRVMRESETSFYRDGIGSIAGSPRVLVRVELSRAKGERVYTLEVSSPNQRGQLVSLNVTTREFWVRPYDRIDFADAPNGWVRSQRAHNGTLRPLDAAHYRVWNYMREVRDLALESGFTAQMGSY